jgi:hypothetical protein
VPAAAAAAQLLLDINCNQKDYNGKPQPFCKICDGLNALADACDNNPE